jgi:alpha-glucosidase
MMKKHSKYAQSLIERLGPLKSFSRHPGGISLLTATAELQISIWEAGVIRVQARKLSQEWEKHSYAVVGKPCPVDWTLDESPEMLRIKTPLLAVEVLCNPVSVRFVDHDGVVLSQDDPEFGTHWQGQEVAHYRKLHEGERFVGLGEKTGGLDRRGSSYINWNTDNFAYGTEADPLYLSAPFFIGLVNERIYGLFLDNTFKTTFNFGASSDRYSWISAEAGILDYYFFHASDIPGILQSYTKLTGATPLPPKWSLGFQQCRYSYYPDKELLSVARTFREKCIPADVLYLDIHYMDEYKVFTWHPERFPDPKGLCEQLKALGFRVAVIIDPGVKVESGYAAYDSGVAGDHFATYPDGEAYQGQVWPGWSHFPDFTSESTRNWWSEQFDVLTDAGVEGFWNDMNEPAAWGQHLPNAILFDWEGEGATHKKARNVYGMQMARATREGVEALMGNKRPFVLTRAGFAGVQRYSTVWTGDNVAYDGHMLAGVRLVNSLGLTGIPFAGYDVGGFVGESSPALFAKWLCIGAFTPFFRGHTMINSRDSEPWSYGEEVEDIARNYIGLRYQLMPYLYSQFDLATRTGMPVARSLAISNPFEPNTYSSNFYNQFMFGPSILVAPSEPGRDLLKVWLPSGGWREMFTGLPYPGGQVHIVEQSLDRLPVFVKDSALIMAQSLVQHMDEMPTDLLTLHVYAGDANFELNHYEDDGETNAHAAGEFARRTILHEGANRVLTMGKVDGNFKSPFKRLRVVVHGLADAAFSVNGKKLASEISNFRWMEPVSRFDPFGGAGKVYEEVGLPFAEMPWVDAEFEIKY